MRSRRSTYDPRPRHDRVDLCDLAHKLSGYGHGGLTRGHQRNGRPQLSEESRRRCRRHYTVPIAFIAAVFGSPKKIDIGDLT